MVARIDWNVGTFQCAHGDNKATHQDALAHFADAELFVSATRNNGGRTRFVVFVLALDHGTRGLVGTHREL